MVEIKTESDGGLDAILPESEVKSGGGGGYKKMRNQGRIRPIWTRDATAIYKSKIGRIYSRQAGVNLQGCEANIWRKALWRVKAGDG